ncbi:Uncharacterised protein [Streptococcus pneumoniae]|nr:Uncharacterised protein [Streptococcus pneumoniae]
MNKSNSIYEELNKVKIELKNYLIFELTPGEKENLKKAVLKELKL